MTSADPKRYETAAEGLKALEGAYDYWTGRITDLTFQSSLALIAANWALISGLHPPGCARDLMIISTIIALASLLVGLWGALHMAELHRKQFRFAEQHREAWHGQWEQSESTESEWPYTKEIESHGRYFRNAKFLLLVAAGAVFMAGAIMALL